MSFFGISPTDLATFVNVVTSSIVVILAFSLLAYTITYNVRNKAARYFALFLICIVVAYAGDVALNRVLTAGAANIWLRVQWLGIAMLPWAYYIFSRSVVGQTNTDVPWGREISIATFVLSTLAAVSGFFGSQLVGTLYFKPPLSYLESGPYFWFFAGYFVLSLFLSLANIVKARQNSLTESSRKRMNYLLFGFVAPGIGIFPYLIVLGSLSTNTTANAMIFLLALAGNLSVAVFLVLMSYTVAYFGVLTPDRVVRYRLIRFFTRGPIVAILVILAIQTVPPIERVLGLPRDIVLFSVITGVIICSQIILSTTKTLVDRMVYREDLDEAAWLRELDRRLLTTSDLRQFLENNLTALCELLQAPGGFVAAVVGPDLMLEATVGIDDSLDARIKSENWSNVLSAAQVQVTNKISLLEPIEHAGFWVWPLVEPLRAEPPRAATSSSDTSRSDTSSNGSSVTAAKAFSEKVLPVKDSQGSSTQEPNERATILQSDPAAHRTTNGRSGKNGSDVCSASLAKDHIAIGILAVLNNGMPINSSNLGYSSHAGAKMGTDTMGSTSDAEDISSKSNTSGQLNGFKQIAAFTGQETDAITRMIERTGRALIDRQLQQDVFGALRRIIPEMDRMQELRGAATYISSGENPTENPPLAEPGLIHSSEFNGWVKDALSHYWGGPKLTRSPLTQLRVVNTTLEKADNDPTKALRLVLGSAIDRLKPGGEEELNKPEWLLYNIVSMRFIEGKKVREIANRLAMSESDLYRKQRVAIGQVARVITEMEQGD